MNIRFFNNFHRGDIHFSRTFVRHAMNEIRKMDPSAKFFYHHPNQPECVSDIPDLTHVPDRAPQLQTPDPLYGDVWGVVGEDMCINTWIGAGQMKWTQPYGGCTFRGNLDMWEHIMSAVYNFYDKPFVPFPKRPEVKPDPPHKPMTSCDHLLPWIDWKGYNTVFVDDHMSATKGKYRQRVFVSNGMVLSGQAINFDFSPIIGTLAKAAPDVAFYMSNTHPLNHENVYTNADIIKSNKCDLNENAYIAMFCDVIVGRASGPWSFATMRETCQDPNKIWLNFANSYREGLWHYEGQGEYRHYNGGDTRRVQAMIAEAIS